MLVNARIEGYEWRDLEVVLTHELITRRQDQ